MYRRSIATLRWPVCRMIARSEAPWTAASVANPARREWPANSRGPLRIGGQNVPSTKSCRHWKLSELLLRPRRGGYLMRDRPYFDRVEHGTPRPPGTDRVSDYAGEIGSSASETPALPAGVANLDNGHYPGNMVSPRDAPQSPTHVRVAGDRTQPVVTEELRGSAGVAQFLLHDRSYGFRTRWGQSLVTRWATLGRRCGP
jgi:hypothetical protein